MGEESKGGKVKVVDRRWFTAEGEPREELPVQDTGAEKAVPSAPAPPAPPAAPATPPPAGPPQSAQDDSAKRVPEEFRRPSEVGLLDLVDLLAQQALAFMSGQVPGHGRDLQAGRHFIDLLGVLQEKTKRQLSPQEASYLDDVLYQLRTLYLAPPR